MSKNTDEGFMDRFNMPITKATNIKHGKPMFVKEDVQKTPYSLTRILRMIFVENGITPEYFSDRFREYAITHKGLLPSDINTPKGNLLKALKAQRVTDKKFMEVLSILGYDVLSMTFELQDKDGNVVEYKY